MRKTYLIVGLCLGLAASLLLITGNSNRLAATQQPAEPLTFGPVIERVINEGDFIDFGTGRVLPPPDDLDLSNKEALSSWAKNNAMDARLVIDGKGRGLRFFDLFAGYMTGDSANKEWNELSAKSLRKGLYDAWWGIIRFGRLPDEDEEAKRINQARNSTIKVDELPVTVSMLGFGEGAESAFGLLQIVGFTENPKGVKICYKMVQNGQPSEQQSELLFRDIQETHSILAARTSYAKLSLLAKYSGFPFGPVTNRKQYLLAGRDVARASIWHKADTAKPELVQEVLNVGKVSLNYEKQATMANIFIRNKPNVVPGRDFLFAPLFVDAIIKRCELKGLTTGDQTLEVRLFDQRDTPENSRHITATFEASKPYRLLKLLIEPNEQERIFWSYMDYQEVADGLWFPTQIQDRMELLKGKYTCDVTLETIEFPRSIPNSKFDIEISRATLRSPIAGQERRYIKKSERFGVEYLRGLAPPDEEAKIPWGEPVEGVQVRLRPEKTSWKITETPKLVLDIRNRGKDMITFVRAAEAQCEIEYDGQWYMWGDSTPIAMTQRHLDPGRDLYNALDVEPFGIRLVDSLVLARGGKRLELTPGKHKVRVRFTHEGRGGIPPDPGWWRRSAISNPVEIEIQPATKAGEPVAGLKCDAKPLKTRFTFGERPRFEATLTNTSDRPVEIIGYAQHPDGAPTGLHVPCASVRVTYPDGHYYQTGADDATKNPIAVRINQGQSWSFELPTEWKDVEEARPADPNSLPRVWWLLPGTYTAQVTYFIRDVEKDLLSANLVYGPDAGDLAGRKPQQLWEGIVRSIPVNFEVLEDDSKQLAILKAIYAGEGLEHLRFELTASKTTVHASQTTSLNRKVHNTGSQRVYIGGGPFSLREKGPRGPQLHGGGLGGGVRAIDPGKTLLLGGCNFGSGEPLVAGTYTVSAEYTGPGHEGNILAKSNELTITVLEKATQPAEEWVEPVEGVQVRLRADKKVWQAGGIPSLRANVRNQGKRDLFVAQAQQVCELELDGQWYTWQGEISVRSSWFPPDREYKNIPISLGKEWHSKVGHRSLTLTLDKHTVRISFMCRPTGNDAGKEIRVISNPVEIEIIPAPQE